LENSFEFSEKNTFRITVDHFFGEGAGIVYRYLMYQFIDLPTVLPVYYIIGAYNKFKFRLSTLMDINYMLSLIHEERKISEGKQQKLAFPHFL